MLRQICFYPVAQSQHSRAIPPQSQPPIGRVTIEDNLPALKRTCLPELFPRNQFGTSDAFSVLMTYKLSGDFHQPSAPEHKRMDFAFLRRHHCLTTSTPSFSSRTNAWLQIEMRWLRWKWVQLSCVNDLR